MEIDRTHGINPVHGKADVVLMDMKVSAGGLRRFPTPSSIGILKERLDALEQCGKHRLKEIAAIRDHFVHFQSDCNQRTLDFQKRMHEKIYEACDKKFANMEKNIMATVTEDLALLRQ